MWNTSIKFPYGYKQETDKSGVKQNTPLYVCGIPANKKDTTRNDEILAKQIGYTAEVIYEVMECNYTGSSILIDESTDIEYEIKRSYKKEKSNLIELTCEKR